MFLRRWFNYPTVGWRAPFEEIERVRSQMDRLLNELSGHPARSWAGVFPLVNVTESKDAYWVRAELPGMKANEIEISLTGSKLAISGERKIPAEEKAKYHRREREAGKFSRIISLQNDIDGSKVEAKCADGILTIVLPKAESAKPRQIQVK